MHLRIAELSRILNRSTLECPQQEPTDKKEIGNLLLASRTRCRNWPAVVNFGSAQADPFRESPAECSG